MLGVAPANHVDCEVLSTMRTDEAQTRSRGTR